LEEGRRERGGEEVREGKGQGSNRNKKKKSERKNGRKTERWAPCGRNCKETGVSKPG